MSIIVIILLALISQVWLLSYFYPKQIVKRINYVLTHCPEHEFPKLYPVPSKRINTIKNIYLVVNWLFVFFGLGLIFYYAYVVTDFKQYLNILDDLPLLFGIVQFLPLFILEILGHKHLKLMRKQYSQSNRKAALQPRRVFNFVSPYHVGLVVFTYIIFIFFELYLSDFTFNRDASIKIATVTLVNVLFTILAMANLYGKKRDPYQDEHERNKQTAFVFTSFVFISIFMTIYLMMHSWVNVYELNYVEILINSLYFQVLALFSIGALLGRLKIEQINFNVYKAQVNN